MRKRPPKQSDRSPIIGVAWLDRVQWQRLTEVVEDRSELGDTFEQWERSALDVLRMFERQGHRVERVNVKVGAFVSWCNAKGLPINGKSRAKYVPFLLRERHASSKA